MSIKRIEERIKKLLPEHLKMLCRLPDGTERVMDVQEMIDTGSEFIKVVRGSNMADLDKMLKYDFENIRVMEQ